MPRRPDRRAGAPGFLPLAPMVLAAAFGCAAPGAGDAPTPATGGGAESASVGGYHFHLEDDRLRYTGPGGAAGAFALGTPLDCRLARDAAGEVRTHATEAGLVFLVVCSEVERQMGGRPLCDTLVRGVVVGEGGPRLPERAQRVGACAPFAWDEQMFLYFAE